MEARGGGGTEGFCGQVGMAGGMASWRCDSHCLDGRREVRFCEKMEVMENRQERATRRRRGEGVEWEEALP
jgi:hypothetical protein